MIIQDEIVGKWITEQTLLSIVKISFIVDFRKDGSLIMNGNYKNPVFRAVMAFWNLKIQGTYSVNSKNRLRISLEGLSSYPTRLIDQALRSLRIQISVDEFVSILFSSFSALVGADEVNGVPIKFSGKDIMILNDVTWSRLD